MVFDVVIFVVVFFVVVVFIVVVFIVVVFIAISLLSPYQILGFWSLTLFVHYIQKKIPTCENIQNKKSYPPCLAILGIRISTRSFHSTACQNAKVGLERTKTNRYIQTHGHYNLLTQLRETEQFFLLQSSKTFTKCFLYLYIIYIL